MNGGNLEFYLNRLNHFKQLDVEFYSAQIICAILFLHEKNYFNLNINLKSILLDSNGNCKLMDDLSCFTAINVTHNDKKYEVFDYKDLGILINQMLIGINSTKTIELSDESKEIIDDLINKKKYQNIKKHLFFNYLDWIKLETGKLTPPSFILPGTNNLNYQLVKIKQNKFSYLDNKDIIENLNNEIEMINETVLFSIELHDMIGKGGFGTV
jgi:hypothetical protein